VGRPQAHVAPRPQRAQVAPTLRPHVARSLGRLGHTDAHPVTDEWTASTPSVARPPRTDTDARCAHNCPSRRDDRERALSRESAHRESSTGDQAIVIVHLHGGKRARFLVEQRSCVLCPPVPIFGSFAFCGRQAVYAPCASRVSTAAPRSQCTETRPEEPLCPDGLNSRKWCRCGSPLSWCCVDSALLKARWAASRGVAAVDPDVDEVVPAATTTTSVEEGVVAMHSLRRCQPVSCRPRFPCRLTRHIRTDIWT
jgi:hypothetical protein